MNRISKELVLLIVLSGIQFTHMVDFVIMMPLGPQFMRDFQIGPDEFGWMVSAYTYAAAVSGLIGALFVDRFDRKLVLLFLYTGFIVGTLLCAAAPDHLTFILARVVAGSFAGILTANVFAIIGDTIPEARRGAAMGTVMSSFSLASIVGVPLGLWLAQASTWKMPFLALSVLSAVIWVIGFFFLPSMRSHLSHLATGEKSKRLTVAELFQIIRGPNFWPAVGLSSALMLSGFSVIPFIATYFVSNTGYPESKLPFMYLVGGLITLSTARYIGKLSDRFGKPRVFWVLAASYIIPVLLVTHLGPSPLWVSILICATFMVFASGRMIPAMTLITSGVSPARRGSFMSVNSAVQQFTCGVAATLSGLIITMGPDGQIQHYNRVGYLAVTVSGLAIWISRRIKVVS